MFSDRLGESRRDCIAALSLRSDGASLTRLPGRSENRALFFLIFMDESTFSRMDGIPIRTEPLFVPNPPDSPLAEECRLIERRIDADKSVVETQVYEFQQKLLKEYNIEGQKGVLEYTKKLLVQERLAAWKKLVDAVNKGEYGTGDPAVIITSSFDSNHNLHYSLRFAHIVPLEKSPREINPNTLSGEKMDRKIEDDALKESDIETVEGVQKLRAIQDAPRHPLPADHRGVLMDDVIVIDGSRIIDMGRLQESSFFTYSNEPANEHYVEVHSGHMTPEESAHYFEVLRRHISIKHLLSLLPKEDMPNIQPGTLLLYDRFGDSYPYYSTLSGAEHILISLPSGRFAVFDTPQKQYGQSISEECRLKHETVPAFTDNTPESYHALFERGITPEEQDFLLAFADKPRGEKESDEDYAIREKLHAYFVKSGYRH